MGATLNSDVRHSHPQRWVLAGAIFTLLQSGALLSSAAVGLSLYTCSLKITGSEIWQMVRLYYFSNVHCSSQFIVNELNYALEGVNDAAYRTMIIMSCYTALSGIWFIGSLFLLVSATKGKHMSPVVGRYLHYPWTVSLILILVLDVNASILYCVDLLSTTDFNTVMGLVNIKPDGNLHELNNDYLSTPPLIMAALTSKGIVLWIVDVIILVVMIKHFRELFLIRQQAEFMRAQLATMPAYLWPPKLVQKNQQKNKEVPAPIETAPTIPRLVNQDGILVGTTQSSSTIQRSSTLQMAQRQGFSYERPPGSTYGLNTRESHSHIPRVPTPQKYGYSGFSQASSENWYHRGENPPARENNRSSNILQRDNDVFY